MGTFTIVLDFTIKHTRILTKVILSEAGTHFSLLALASRPNG